MEAEHGVTSHLFYRAHLMSGKELNLGALKLGCALSLNSRPGRLLVNDETRFSTFGILGVPEIDLVLDTLGAGAVLELREGQ
jgi:hypothetical protein